VRGKRAEAPSMYSGSFIKAKKNVRSEEKKSGRAAAPLSRSPPPVFPVDFVPRSGTVIFTRVGVPLVAVNVFDYGSACSCS